MTSEDIKHQLIIITELFREGYSENLQTLHDRDMFLFCFFVFLSLVELPWKKIKTGLNEFDKGMHDDEG